MKPMKMILGTMSLFVLLMMTFQPQAHAYLDPGSGGFFIQMVLAGLVGLSFMMKNFWKKVKDFFVKLFKGGKGPDKKA